MKHSLISRIVTGLGAGAAASALAHEGHGLPGSAHWHASDAWGFVIVAVLIVLSLWFTRGGK